MMILTLPRDVGLDKDNFQKSKIFNTTDSLINYILNILIMRPGNMPGMPELGVNIGQYVNWGKLLTNKEVIASRK